MSEHTELELPPAVYVIRLKKFPRDEDRTYLAYEFSHILAGESRLGVGNNSNSVLLINLRHGLLEDLRLLTMISSDSIVVVT